jgi:predicted alpha/beta superfamily hydrolase
MKTLSAWLTILLLGSGAFAQSGISYNTEKPELLKNESITGRVDFYKKFKSIRPGSRGVSVWLPPNYESDTLTRYPVLYLQDGQSIFNAETQQFKSDWKADETADSLIRAGAIEPIIIVAVNATLNRFTEYTPTAPKGEDYMLFLNTELKPFIDRRYRTLPGREHTAAGGSSAGGLLAFSLAWQHDSIYSKVISFSPSFELLFFDYTETVKKDKEAKNLKICFYHGGVGIEKGLQEGVDKMIKVLNRKNFEQGKDYIKLYGSDEKHFGPGWGNYFGPALEFLFGKE